MGSRALELYENLINLSNDPDSPFYHVDHISPFDSHLYRVFTYRLGSYNDFIRPDALECRGHMFRICEDRPPELVSLPFPKFFNRGENPLTMDLDFSDENVEHIATKEDGSLISTYLDAEGVLRLKSKTALTSSMALDAMDILPSIHAPFSRYSLEEYCVHLEGQGYTVSMEYVSPSNRIVLPYEEANLVVLGVRHRDTMALMTYDEMVSIGIAPFYTAENVVDSHRGKVAEFVDQIASMSGIEGFVIRLKNGQLVKIKTDWYVALHHAKDSVTAPRRLMEAVLEEATDDLRQMFSDDEQALREIENMEVFVTHTVAHLTKPVNAFYEANRGLERKDYAIKAKTELTADQFPLAMGEYTGKKVDWKAYVSKNYQKFLANYQTTLTTGPALD